MWLTTGPTVALKTPLIHWHQMVAPSRFPKETSWKANFKKFSTNLWKPRRKKKLLQRIWRAYSKSNRWGNSYPNKVAQELSQECQHPVEASRPSGLLYHPNQLQTSTLRLGVPWYNCLRTSIRITTLRSSKASICKNGSSPTGLLEVYVSRQSSRTKMSSSSSCRTWTIKTYKINSIPQIFWVNLPRFRIKIRKLVTRFRRI